MSDQASQSSDYMRSRFAAEQTLLAYVRTGLAFMGFGFVVARFGLFLHVIAGTKNASRDSSAASLWIGTGLVVLGVVVTFLAAVENRRVLRRLDQGDPFEPPGWSLGLFLATGLMVIGVGIVAYLLQVGV